MEKACYSGGKSAGSSCPPFETLTEECFEATNFETNKEKKNSSSRIAVEKLVERVDSLQQQLLQQNLLFQQKILLIETREQQQNERLRKFKENIEKILEQHKCYDEFGNQIRQFRKENAEEQKWSKQLIDSLKSDFQQQVEKSDALNERIKMDITLLKNNFCELSTTVEAHLDDGTRHLPKVSLGNVNNIWFATDGDCCPKKCIGLNPNGSCERGNGVVRLRGEMAKYINGSSGVNDSILVFAKNALRRSVDPSFSVVGRRDDILVYYFEVAVQMEGEGSIRVGLSTNKYRYHVDTVGDYECWLKSSGPEKCVKIFQRRIADEDVVGCGVAFCADKRPMIFFTRDGTKFSKRFSVQKDEGIDGDFFPYVQLCSCSVEANFGDKPFRYVIGECAKLEVESGGED